MNQVGIGAIDIHALVFFQKQTTTIILNCLDGLDPETFYNYIFFMMATAALAEIPLYYKKCVF